MPASTNSICDITGIRVGHAHDAAMCSGVTVVLPDHPVIAAVDIRGGAPGTRETDAISGRGIVEHVHGLVLSGGSAFGLSAASAVQQFLAKKDFGFAIGGMHVPIVPQAILFDLLVGDADQSQDPISYFDLAKTACQTASSKMPNCGSVGAGYGATTATLRGGLGTASQIRPDGTTVAAIVAVNAVGSTTMGTTHHFWAHALEGNAEFGGLGPPPKSWNAETTNLLPLKGADALSDVPTNTTIGIVATDAKLTQTECQRLATMAQTGLARALYPVHTPLDGDTIFAISTAAAQPPKNAYELSALGAAAADCMSRAIARGIFEAAPAPSNWNGPPAYKEQFGLDD